jgi:hypothetical protein
MKWNRADRIAAAALAFAVLAAIAAWLVVPEFRSWTGLDSADGASHAWKASVAGIVVDTKTNRGIGQAAVSIVGRAESGVTEDDGNFRINLRDPAPQEGAIRIHVLKSGYAPYDGTTAIPTETLVIQLRRL